MTEDIHWKGLQGKRRRAVKGREMPRSTWDMLSLSCLTDIQLGTASELKNLQKDVWDKPRCGNSLLEIKAGQGPPMNILRKVCEVNNSEDWRKRVPIFKNSAEERERSPAEESESDQRGRRAAGRNQWQVAKSIECCKGLTMKNSGESSGGLTVTGMRDLLGRWRCSTTALWWRLHTSVNSLKPAEHLKWVNFMIWNFYFKIINNINHKKEHIEL